MCYWGGYPTLWNNEEPHSDSHPKTLGVGVWMGPNSRWFVSLPARKQICIQYSDSCWGMWQGRNCIPGRRCAQKTINSECMPPTRQGQRGPCCTRLGFLAKLPFVIPNGGWKVKGSPISCNNDDWSSKRGVTSVPLSWVAFGSTILKVLVLNCYTIALFALSFSCFVLGVKS